MMAPYRSQADYIAHLAIQIAIGEGKDARQAADPDTRQAEALIKRAGIRMYNDPAPDWHRARRAMVMTA